VDTGDWVLQTGSVVVGVISGWFFVARDVVGGFLLFGFGLLAWGVVVGSMTGDVKFNSGGNLIHVDATVIPAFLAVLAGGIATYLVYTGTGREIFPDGTPSEADRKESGSGGGGWGTSFDADRDRDGGGDGD
jgi:hypothetical protein